MECTFLLLPSIHVSICAKLWLKKVCRFFLAWFFVCSSIETLDWYIHTKWIYYSYMFSAKISFNQSFVRVQSKMCLNGRRSCALASAISFICTLLMKNLIATIAGHSCARALRSLSIYRWQNRNQFSYQILCVIDWKPKIEAPTRTTTKIVHTQFAWLAKSDFYLSHNHILPVRYVTAASAYSYLMASTVESI